MEVSTQNLTDKQLRTVIIKVNGYVVGPYVLGWHEDKMAAPVNAGVWCIMHMQHWAISMHDAHAGLKRTVMLDAQQMVSHTDT